MSVISTALLACGLKMVAAAELLKHLIFQEESIMIITFIDTIITLAVFYHHFTAGHIASLVDYLHVIYDIMFLIVTLSGTFDEVVRPGTENSPLGEVSLHIFLFLYTARMFHLEHHPVHKITARLEADRAASHASKPESEIHLNRSTDTRSSTNITPGVNVPPGHKVDDEEETINSDANSLVRFSTGGTDAGKVVDAALLLLEGSRKVSQEKMTKLKELLEVDDEEK
jgi:hypothetical protein